MTGKLMTERQTLHPYYPTLPTEDAALVDQMNLLSQDFKVVLARQAFREFLFAVNNHDVRAEQRPMRDKERRKLLAALRWDMANSHFMLPDLDGERCNKALRDYMFATLDFIVAMGVPDAPETE